MFKQEIHIPLLERIHWNLFSKKPTIKTGKAEQPELRLLSHTFDCQSIHHHEIWQLALDMLELFCEYCTSLKKILSLPYYTCLSIWLRWISTEVKSLCTYEYDENMPLSLLMEFIESWISIRNLILGFRSSLSVNFLQA